MKASGSALAGLTADMLAAGLIAASRRFGLDPLRVFEHRAPRGKKIRACVGGAVLAAAPKARARAGFTKDLALLLKVQTTTFAPSGLAACGICVDDLLTVAEAMRPYGFSSEVLTPSAAASEPEPAPFLNVGKAPAPRPAAPRFDPAKLNDGPRKTPLKPVEAKAPQADAKLEAGDPLRRMFGDDRALVEACNRAGGMPVIDFASRPPRIVGGPARRARA